MDLVTYDIPDLLLLWRNDPDKARQLGFKLLPSKFQEDVAMPMEERSHIGEYRMGHDGMHCVNPSLMKTSMLISKGLMEGFTLALLVCHMQITDC
jgi:hypothetical protein